MWSLHVQQFSGIFFFILAYLLVGVGKTPPRPTSTLLLASRTLVHEDGGRDRDAPFSSQTYCSDYTTGVTETSVGHGPAGAEEAYLLVRASVTRIQQFSSILLVQPSLCRANWITATVSC